MKTHYHDPFLTFLGLIYTSQNMVYIPFSNFTILFSVLLNYFLKLNFYVEKLKTLVKVATRFEPTPSSLNTHLFQVA
jgi:hypothetical protein